MKKKATKTSPKKPARVVRAKRIMPLDVMLVLDCSGSMQKVRDETIQGYNKFVEETRKNDKSGLGTFSSVFFNSRKTTVVEGVPLAKIDTLSPVTYVPEGFTPLYDAIAQGVTKMKCRATKGRLVSLVILTDGEENASREHGLEAIRKLLAEVQKDGWLVQYLGANQDAWRDGGAKIGLMAANVASFDTANIGSTYSALASSQGRYVANAGDLKAAAFNAKERKGMKK